MIRTDVLGNLGRDAEKKKVNGETVINFSVAHTVKYADADGQLVEDTTWVDCAYWKDSDVAKHMKSGQKIFVTGTPYVDTYKNKEGKIIPVLRLRVSRIELAGSTRKESEAQGDPLDDTGKTVDFEKQKAGK